MITLLGRYHAKIFVFSEIFIFQIFLFLQSDNSDCINALYIECTEKLPFSCILQRNSSGPYIDWTLANHSSKEFQDACLGSFKSLLNVIFCVLAPTYLREYHFCDVLYYIKHDIVSESSITKPFILP
jgi:hypothetical protein